MGVVKFPERASVNARAQTHPDPFAEFRLGPANPHTPLNQAGARKVPRRRTGRAFVIAEVHQLRPAMEALSCPAALVWMFLMYEARRRQTDTVTASNVALTRWGISRKVKYHALDRLEAAGLVSVSKIGKQSPRVKILII